MCDACRREWSQFIRRVEETETRKRGKDRDTWKPPYPDPTSEAHASHAPAGPQAPARGGRGGPSPALETVDEGTHRRRDDVEPAGPPPSTSFEIPADAPVSSSVHPVPVHRDETRDAEPAPAAPAQPEAPPAAPAEERPPEAVPPQPAPEPPAPEAEDEEDEDSGRSMTTAPPVSGEPEATHADDLPVEDAASEDAPFEVVPDTPPESVEPDVPEEWTTGDVWADDAAPRASPQRFLCPRCTSAALVADLADDRGVAHCEACHFEVDDLLTLIPVKPVGLLELTLGSGTTAVARAAVFVVVCLALFLMAVMGA